MKLVLTILASCLMSCLFAQKERYFTSEKAIEWLPQLVGTNIQIIGEKNDKQIKATDNLPIEFLFITDTEEKATALIKTIKNNYKYRLHKPYALEGYWLITGVTTPITMEFKTFTKWTVDFCKLGFDEDTKFLSWNFVNTKKKEQIDAFWTWFIKNQDRYYRGIEPDKIKEMNQLFSELQSKLNPINSDLVFEFSPILDNKKREFVLSTDGKRESFPDLLALYKQSPDLDKWTIIPFKQAFDNDPKLALDNGFTLTWDKVKFTAKETSKGLSIDFYISNYNEKEPKFESAMMILLDALLGEYDAVMQITTVDFHKLEKKKDKNLKEFQELKTVVENYKKRKNG